MGDKEERFREEKKGCILPLQFFDIYRSQVHSHSRSIYTPLLRNRCSVPVPVWHTSVVLPQPCSPVHLSWSMPCAMPVFNRALSKRQEFQKDFQAGDQREKRRNANFEYS